MQAVGGPDRNRTDVRGFAVPCMTTLPPGLGRPLLYPTPLPSVKRETQSHAYAGPGLGDCVHRPRRVYTPGKVWADGPPP